MKPGKKGFALLLDAGPRKKKPNDAGKLPPDDGDQSHGEPDGDEDLSDLDGLMDDGDGDEPDDDEGADLSAESQDPFGDDSGSGDASKIDPEAAALATRLGIHEPKKQQALIDLIQLVTGPGFGGGSSTPPPAPSLPESTY